MAIYPAYRQSNVPWARLVPQHWATRTGRRVVRPIQREARLGDGVVTAFRDGEVTLRTNRRTEGFTDAFVEYGYQGVRVGDLVIHGMDGFAGAIGVSDSDGKMSPVVHLYSATEGDPRYLAHSLRVAAGLGYVQSLARGIRERSTAFDRNTFRAMLLPLPPPGEQEEIVSYIDRETAQIDALIERQKRLIETLRERRAAVVAQAFSAVPAERVQLRRLTRLLTSGSRDWGDYYADRGDRFLRIGNLPRAHLRLRGEVQHVIVPDAASRSDRAQLRKHDLLFSITAYLGSVAVVDHEWDGAYVSQHVALCRLDDSRVDPFFLGWFMLTPEGQDQLKQGAAGGTKQQLALPDIRKLRVPLPALDEQRSIVSLVDQQTTQIDVLIAKAEQFITLARERRSALITAAVTGQIDVREAS